jgi:hypothetical protein
MKLRPPAARFCTERRAKATVLSRKRAKSDCPCCAFVLVPAIAALLRCGARVDARSLLDGSTPIFGAVACEKLAAIKLLVDIGKADVNCRNKAGQTLIEYAGECVRTCCLKRLAAHFGCVPAVQYLITLSCDQAHCGIDFVELARTQKTLRDKKIGE